MGGIQYINRQTGQIEVEEVWKEELLQFFYGPSTLASFLLSPLARSPLFSKLVGYYQSLSMTKKDVIPFIQKYKVDPSEFLLDPSDFHSFNDFFIRQLKPEVRPIAATDAIIPADGRYLFYQNLEECPYLIIKGKNYSLKDLEAEDFHGGSVVLGRLCPTDYHRFHFPIDCTPSKPKLMKGALFSVNPIALNVRPSIFYENKRVATILNSKTFGEVLMIEFGATNVGSITETFVPGKPVKKGDEKGYFSFGGSALMLFFKKDAICLNRDLIGRDLEIRCLLGQPLGLASISDHPG